jgi:hypothetical protein
MELHHPPATSRKSQRLIWRMALGANASEGDLSLTMVSGAAASAFAADTYAILQADAFYNGVGGAKIGEFVRIRSVSGSTVNLWGPLKLSYATADDAELVNVNLLTGIGYTDIEVVMDDTVTPAVGSLQDVMGFRNEFCLKPTFTRCVVRDGIGEGIYFTGCLGAKIDQFWAYDLGSADNDSDGSATIGHGGYGYDSRAFAEHGARGHQFCTWSVCATPTRPAPASHKTEVFRSAA